MGFAYEPNDTILTAYDTGLTGVGSFTATGYIGDEDEPAGVLDDYTLDDYTDVDMFKITVEKGNVVVVDSSPLEGGLGSPLSYADVRLFDGSGNLVQYDWEWEDGYLQYKIPSDGSYYVGMSSIYGYGYYNPNSEGDGYDWSEALGDYTLEINVTPNQAPVAEPDEIGAPPSTVTLIPAWQLLGNDSDPDDYYWELAINEVCAGENTQSVSLNQSGDVVFTPTAGLTNTTGTFSYTAKDMYGGVSGLATVTVNLGALLQGGNGPDRIFGDIFGEKNRSDRLEGGGGNDSLAGLTGDDILVGGQGRDLLNGGSGSDRLVGGPDADTLIFNPYGNTAVLEKFNDSLLKAPDVIQVGGSYYGEVNIDVPGDRNLSLYLSNYYGSSLVAKSLSEKEIKDLLEFKDESNSFVTLGAASFQYNTKSGTTQTFLAIDDGNHVFSASSDSIIQVAISDPYYYDLYVNIF